MTIWLRSSEDTKQSRNQTKDNCSECINKLCCVVFRIVDEYNQGRSEDTVKRQGEKCKHLNTSGQCGIHEERKNYKGYNKSCIDYTCLNVGPILDAWIRNHIIDVVEESKSIAWVMGKLIGFLEINNGVEYMSRYIFLREIFLKKYSTIDSLVTAIDRGIEQEYKNQ